jgi:hypothetical protein
LENLSFNRPGAVVQVSGPRFPGGKGRNGPENFSAESRFGTQQGKKLIELSGEDSVGVAEVKGEISQHAWFLLEGFLKSARVDYTTRGRGK